MSTYHIDLIVITTRLCQVQSVCIELLIISGRAYSLLLAMNSPASSGSNEIADRMDTASLDCCGQVRARVEDLEHQLGALSQENKALGARLDDVQHQYSKHCLVCNLSLIHISEPTRPY